jgi:energy-coupling factor transport system substrate-specific component
VLHKPWQLGLFGFCSGLVFSLIMDVWTVLALGEGFQWSRYLAILVTAAPFTVIYAASNAVFLVALKQPVGRRLERIRKKYGL